jgi:hypothetical protein
MNNKFIEMRIKYPYAVYYSSPQGGCWHPCKSKKEAEEFALGLHSGSSINALGDSEIAAMIGHGVSTT